MAVPQVRRDSRGLAGQPGPANCATDGALVKWNRRVRRACERDGAFVAVGQPKAFKDAAKPCVVLEVDLEELCDPPFGGTF